MNDGSDENVLAGIGCRTKSGHSTIPNHTTGLNLNQDGLSYRDGDNGGAAFGTFTALKLITNLDTHNNGFFGFKHDNCANQPSDMAAGGHCGLTINGGGAVKVQMIFNGTGLLGTRRYAESKGGAGSKKTL